jgi:hypothetical protein
MYAGGITPPFWGSSRNACTNLTELTEDSRSWLILYQYRLESGTRIADNYPWYVMERTQRQFCLDMIKVSWVGMDGLKKSDCAIILEIERAGGLVQTTVPIASGSEITLDAGLGLTQGHVTTCEEDAYGYVVNFLIDDRAKNWSPEYVPAFLHSASGR